MDQRGWQIWRELGSRGARRQPHSTSRAENSSFSPLHKIKAHPAVAGLCGALANAGLLDKM
jgi:hypothetical protein